VHCDPAVATVAFDRESQHDLIVMATHGRPVLGGLLQARVTDLVARHSRHPILVIPVMEENPRGGLYRTESDGG
jgi:nucleotide-binding universal stress UspA family protein